MKQTWLNDYMASMDALHVSEQKKQQLTDALLRRVSERKTGGNPMTYKSFRKTFIAVLAAVLLLGTVSAAAYFGGWSRSFERGLPATETTRREAEESGLAAVPAGANASAEANGVTVTAEQTIVDSNIALIALRIEGTALPEGKEPALGELRVNIEAGEQPSLIGWSGGFYDGTVIGENGRTVYDDGTPIAGEGDGTWIRHYYDDDGSLCYELSMSHSGEESFLGKEITVRVESIGYAEGPDYVPVVEGPWELRWTLSGSTASRLVSLDTEIGDSGVRLREAELSPVSFRIVYQTDGIWEGYKTLETFEPRFMGVKLKDGTSYPFLFNGPGSSGYIDMDSCLYQQSFGINRLIDPDEVEALLFLNIGSIPAGMHDLREITEENLYIVAIG